MDTMDTYSFPDPLLVAPATFLVRHLRHRPGQELATHVNSVVVLGAQPVLIDTGAARAREAWAEQTFGRRVVRELASEDAGAVEGPAARRRRPRGDGERQDRFDA